MPIAVKLEPFIEEGRNALTVRADTPALTALDVMARNSAGYVLVVRQGCIVGILSRRDAESSRPERPVGTLATAGPPKIAWLR